MQAVCFRGLCSVLQKQTEGRKCVQECAMQCAPCETWCIDQTNLPCATRTGDYSSRTWQHMPQPLHHSSNRHLWMPRSLLAALELSKFASANQRWHLGHWTFEEIPTRTCFHHTTGTACSSVEIWVVSVDLALALGSSFCHGRRLLGMPLPVRLGELGVLFRPEIGLKPTDPLKVVLQARDFFTSHKSSFRYPVVWQFNKNMHLALAVPARRNASIAVEVWPEPGTLQAGNVKRRTRLVKLSWEQKNFCYVL